MPVFGLAGGAADLKPDEEKLTLFEPSQVINNSNHQNESRKIIMQKQVQQLRALCLTHSVLEVIILKIINYLITITCRKLFVSHRHNRCHNRLATVT